MSLLRELGRLSIHSMRYESRVLKAFRPLSSTRAADICSSFDAKTRGAAHSVCPGPMHSCSIHLLIPTFKTSPSSNSRDTVLRGWAARCHRGV